MEGARSDEMLQFLNPNFKRIKNKNVLFAKISTLTSISNRPDRAIVSPARTFQ
jgi:hypothetical protein